MRAINHALTGALIGLTVSDPVIAMPAAFLSHFVLDAIPHFDFKDKKLRKEEDLKDKRFIYSLPVDALLCLILVIVIFWNKPIHWVSAIICAFLAASPDLFSFNHFYKYLRNKPWKGNLYTKFAGKIQWFEKPIGAVVEAVWLIGMLILIGTLLKR